MKNVNVRIDEGVSSVVGGSVTKGAAGEVLDIQRDEVKVRLYWNPANVPGQGHEVTIWVKKAIFGISFDIE